MLKFCGPTGSPYFRQEFCLADGLIPDKAAVSFSKRGRRYTVVESPEISFNRGNVGAEWLKKLCTLSTGQALCTYGPRIPTVLVPRFSKILPSSTNIHGHRSIRTVTYQTMRCCHQENLSEFSMNSELVLVLPIFDHKPRPFRPTITIDQAWAAETSNYGGSNIGNILKLQMRADGVWEAGCFGSFDVTNESDDFVEDTKEAEDKP